jgi:DNA-binding NarL/FixJ family response regulator
MKLLVADGHEVVRFGLREWCEGWTVFEAADNDEAVRLYRKHKPDIVVIESRLPGDGLECLSRIKASDAGSHVLIFSGYDNPTYIARAIALGAQGYLSKGATNKEFVAAVKSVAAGGDVWTRDELRQVSGALAGSDGHQLTKREGEVLKQLAFGLTNKEIAQALGISYETVKEHVQHILRKLGVSDRTQAAVWAVRKELV